MKIMIVCSTSFYDKVENIKNKLIKYGYEVVLPNGYESINDEKSYDEMSNEEYCKFFKDMFIESREKINDVDSIIVLNYSKEKNGKVFSNYIGASTFLEIYEACMQNKKIYLLNEIPNNMLSDEIKGFNPVVLNGKIELLGEILCGTKTYSKNYMN